MKKAIFFISLSMVLFITCIILTVNEFKKGNSSSNNKDVTSGTKKSSNNKNTSGTNSKKNSDDGNRKVITITLYKFGTKDVIKEVKITDEKEIEKMYEYRNNIKPLTECTNTTLADQIDIVYDDGNSVGFNKGIKSLCYYDVDSKNVDEYCYSFLPEEMYDFVLKKLDLN